MDFNINSIFISSGSAINAIVGFKTNESCISAGNFWLQSNNIASKKGNILTAVCVKS